MHRFWVNSATLLPGRTMGFGRIGGASRRTLQMHGVLRGSTHFFPLRATQLRDCLGNPGKKILFFVGCATARRNTLGGDLAGAGGQCPTYFLSKSKMVLSWFSWTGAAGVAAISFCALVLLALANPSSVRCEIRSLWPD